MTGSALQVAAALQGATTVLADLVEELPARLGLYAWWAPPGTLSGLTGPGHPLKPLELRYAGVATSLRARLLRDQLGRRSRNSTLHRALAALLQEQYATCWVAGRVALVLAEEDPLNG